MRCHLLAGICSVVGFLLGATFFGVGLLFYAEFDSIFGQTVRQQMVIDDQVFWWYKIWLQPPVRETLTIHMFEVENADEWRKNVQQQLQQKTSAKIAKVRPQLREIGPFVFRVERIKERVNFTASDKQQIRYDERTVYRFDELLSYENLHQSITVVNSELMIINPFVVSLVRRASRVSRLSRSLTLVINEILQVYCSNLLVERPIWRIIFGPNYKPNQVTDEDDDDNNLEENNIEEENFDEMAPDEITNHTGISMQLLQTPANESSNEQAAKITDDAAVLKILQLYDQIRDYLKRLGVEVDPYDLLFGHYEPVTLGGLVFKKKKFPKKGRLSKMYRTNTVMSFFNNNSLDKFDIYTGIENTQNAQIIRWNNRNLMNSWFGRPCNMINGTDGRQYSPFLRENRIYEFVPRVCRSVPMSLNDMSITSSYGVSFRRFIKSDDFMQSPYRNEQNGCFCRYPNNTKRCNFDGILDLSNCYGGTPVILTNPHFSGRITRSIAKEISGLTPDELIYQSYLDVEPVSGIVLDKANRFQFNIHISSIPVQLNSNRTLQELILPLFWYQEQWTASSEYQNHIKYFFIYPLKYQELGIFALIGVGMGLLGLSLLCFCCCCCGGGNVAAGKSQSKVVKISNSKVDNTSDNPVAYSVEDANKAINDPMFDQSQYGDYLKQKSMEQIDQYQQFNPFNSNEAYYDNQNYVDDNGVPLPPPSFPQTEVFARQEQMLSTQQYPLKRLKALQPPLPPVSLSRRFNLPGRGGQPEARNPLNEPDLDYDFYKMNNDRFLETNVSVGANNNNNNLDFPDDLYQDEYGLNQPDSMGQYGMTAPNGQRQQQPAPPPSYINYLPSSRGVLPPPPPPNFPNSIPQENGAEEMDLGSARQNLLNEIRQGTTLRKITPNDDQLVSLRSSSPDHQSMTGPSWPVAVHQQALPSSSNLVINIATANEQRQQYHNPQHNVHTSMQWPVNVSSSPVPYPQWPLLYQDMSVPTWNIHNDRLLTIPVPFATMLPPFGIVGLANSMPDLTNVSVIRDQLFKSQLFQNLFPPQQHLAAHSGSFNWQSSQIGTEYFMLHNILSNNNLNDSDTNSNNIPNKKLLLDQLVNELDVIKQYKSLSKSGERASSEPSFGKFASIEYNPTQMNEHSGHIENETNETIEPESQEMKTNTIEEKEDKTKSDFEQQAQQQQSSTGSESIRFYGPYRAYNGNVTTTNRDQNEWKNNVLNNEQNTSSNEWDTSFDDDDDDD